MHALHHRPIQEGELIADKYRLVRKVGTGNFGDVFLARHEWINSLQVAVKVLHPRHLGRPELLRRFHREAEIAAILKSRYATRAIDFGLCRGTPFLVMEYLEGRSLFDYVRDTGPIGFEQARRWGIQACLALEEAHSYGVVHRDIKPANLFLAQDTDDERFSIRVLDLGVAKILESSSPQLSASRTGTSRIYCTPAYASPELLRGDIGPGVDVYALGLTLAEALEGRPVYSAGAGIDITLKHLSPDPAPLGERTRSSPLAAVIKQAVAKNVDERFATAHQLRTALEEIDVAPAQTARTASSVANLAPLRPQSSVASDKKLVPPAQDAASPHASVAARVPNGTPVLLAVPPMRQRMSEWALAFSLGVLATVLLVIATRGPF